MWAEIDADQIHQAEHAGRRESHGPAHDGVGLLHLQPHIEGQHHRRLYPVGADAVGDEARRVTAGEHRLAEHDIAKRSDVFGGSGTRFRPRHQFQQPHIARRIEEMGDDEIRFQILRHVAHQLGKRNGRGIGGYHRTRLPHGGELAVQRLLDIQLFDHRLDDPVAFAKARQIILDIARRDQPDCLRSHQRRWLHCLESRNGRFGDGIAIRFALFDDIEQLHRNSGIGDMGCNRGSHHSGADHRDRFNRSRHHTASRIVAIPCPPPMHCVARAYLPPSRCKTAAALPVMRAPVAPIG